MTVYTILTCYAVKLIDLNCFQLTAFMMNYMTWNTDDSDPFLEVDVKLNLTLEVVL